MRSFALCLVLISINTACGGGGGGITPPPPPTDVCPNIAGTQTEVPSGMVKDNAGNCVTPPPVRIKDTISVAIGRPDVLDLAPTDIFVDAVSSDSVTVQPTVWGAEFKLIVPTGQASIKLNFRGGSKYESRSYIVAGGNGLRYARVMHPNCWTMREGEFSGQTKCLSRNALTSRSGPMDALSFYHEWAPGSLLPIGWADNLLPAKVRLADPYSAGANWTASDSTLVHSQITRVNQSWGRTMLVMAGRKNDTIPAIGEITLMRRLDNSQPNAGFPASGTAGEITSGRVIMAKDGFLGSTNVNNIAHEFMHALGFGHTCSWVTQMYTTECKDRWSPNFWFTADDIAGFQLAYAIRAQSKKINANLSWF